MTNQKNIHFIWLTLALAYLFASSCKKAENVIIPIPDISISSSTISEKYIGDTLKLEPAISYGGQPANFKYKWYKYVTVNYTPMLKLISEEKALKYPLDSLGQFQLRLEVTNQSTNVMASNYTTFNVVSRAERGWYILKATADGNTEMDAFYAGANGQSSIFNIISNKNNGQPMKGLPVGLSFMSNYRYYNNGGSSIVTNNACFIPVSTKEAYSYRIKDERIVANTNQIFYEVPAEGTRNFGGIIATSTFTSIVNNGRLHTMNAGANSFLPDRIGTYSISPYFTQNPVMTGSGYILAFDETSSSFVNIRTGTTDINYFPDIVLTKASSPSTLISSNKLGGKLVFLENTAGSLDTSLLATTRAYGLLKKTGSSDLQLLGLNMYELLATPNGATHSIVRTSETLSSSSLPDLTSATLFTLNKNNPILYYVKGNRIGSYNIDTRVHTANAYSLPNGEEITFIKFIDCQYDNVITNNFRNLVVATYLNGKYKVYRFTVLGNTIAQTGTLFEGTGKVKSLMFSSPNTTATTGFANSLYTYY